MPPTDTALPDTRDIPVTPAGPDETDLALVEALQLRPRAPGRRSPP
ncbi:hypothetical protein ACFQ3Z_02735 [Streptomyces nogalater]